MLAEHDRAGKLSHIDVTINSGGGLVSDGLAIYTALSQHPAFVTVTIMGVAASAASLIAMAGDEVEIAEGALVMVHNPALSARGGRRELEAALSAYDAMRSSALKIYSDRSGQTPEAVGEMMDRETWMTSDQAVANGFATKVLKNKAAMSADLDFSMLREVHPAALALVKTADQPTLDRKETPEVPEAQTIEAYKANLKRFNEVFGPEAGMTYLAADLSFEDALVRHTAKLSADLKAANDATKAANDATAAAKAELAAVKTPGESTPVPGGSGKDGDKKPTLESLVRIK